MGCPWGGETTRTGGPRGGEGGGEVGESIAGWHADGKERKRAGKWECRRAGKWEGMLAGGW